MVEEESRFGWELLEKLNDACLRFKRPVAERGVDSSAPEGVDPYRTRVGPGPIRHCLKWSGVWAVLTAAGAAVFTVIYECWLA